MACTPWPLKASRVRWSAAVKLVVLSHLESRYATRSWVPGSSSSATPSVLLLISSSAWCAPRIGDHEIALYPAACVSNIGNSIPSRTSVTRGGAVCGGRLLSAVEYVSPTPA
eukprot:1986199-Prymnesium_polylepis.1